MRLPRAPDQYDRRNETQRNLVIELADQQTHKRDEDLEIGAARLILKSPDGTRYQVKVDNSGNLSAATV